MLEKAKMPSDGAVLFRPQSCLVVTSLGACPEAFASLEVPAAQQTGTMSLSENSLNHTALRGDTHTLPPVSGAVMLPLPVVGWLWARCFLEALDFLESRVSLPPFCFMKLESRAFR